jgi:uncharacterized membrane protein YvbJ
MFCPSCGRENPENVAFCLFCGKAMTPAATPKPERKDTRTNPTPKAKISFTAVKALVTVLLIVGLALVILQLYYPAVLPWN